MEHFSEKPGVILVLGMHRSGTSLVAQLIGRWGAYSGDKLMAANEFNQDGYWEYIPLVNFHLKLLKFTNNTWYAPAQEYIVDDLLSLFGDEARSLVNKMDHAGRVWFWKDPRLILFLDFWTKILEDRDIKVVVTSRDIEAIVQSLRYRDKFPPFLSISLWEYTSSLLFSWLKGKEYFFINYEQLICKPDKTTGELIRFLKGNSGKAQKDVSVPDINSVVKLNLDHSVLSPGFQLTAYQEKLLSIYRNPGQVECFILPSEEIKSLLAFFELFTYLPEEFFKPYHSKIYYGDNSGFLCEQKTLICNGLTNNPIFRFQDPCLISTIRFDPLEDYIFIRFNQIQFYLKGERIDVAYSLTSNAVEVTGDHYLFDNPDPQIHLDLKGINPILIDEIRILMDYLETGKNALNLALERTRKSLISKDRENSQILEESRQALMEREKFEKLMVIAENDLKKANNQILEFQNTLEQLQVTLRIKLKEAEGYTEHLKAAREELAGLYKSPAIRFEKRLRKILEKNKLVLLLISVKKNTSDKRGIRIIRKSGFFDREYYLLNNPDVKESGMDPLEHFYKHGAIERRNPSKEFNTGFYLDNYPDVVQSRVNPLYHFIKYGIKEKRQSRPIISYIEKRNREMNSLYRSEAPCEDRKKKPS